MFDHPLALYTKDELQHWMQAAGLRNITIKGNTTVTSYLDEGHGQPDYTNPLSLEIDFGPTAALQRHLPVSPWHRLSTKSVPSTPPLGRSSPPQSDGMTERLPRSR